MNHPFILTLALVLTVGAFTAKADEEKSKFVPAVSDKPAQTKEDRDSKRSLDAYKRFKNHERAEQEASPSSNTKKE